MSMISEQVKNLRGAADTLDTVKLPVYAQLMRTQSAKLHATNMERSTTHYNGWIPCNKRLPEEYGEYLCVSEYGKFILGMPDWNEKCGYFVETDSQFMYDVIAWRPLPEPYKEVEA